MNKTRDLTLLLLLVLRITFLLCLTFLRREVTEAPQGGENDPCLQIQTRSAVDEVKEMGT